jgi:6-phospho-3-hexuloisomerase
VLLLISGSGSSTQLNGIRQSAMKQGAHIALVTANGLKLHEEWCSSGLLIPAATKQRRAEEPSTIQPLGNQFDQAVHLVLDAAIIDGPYAGLANDNVIKNHTNLE